MNALVLEGGGVKGSYQVGAYLALKDNGIIIDGFYGTSIGSVNGAIFAVGNEEKLLDFWMNLDPAVIFGLEKKISEAINKKVYDVDFFVASLKSIVKTLANRGVDTEPLLNALDSLLTEEDLINSDKEYGLVTYRVKDLSPVEIYKENIPKGKLKECILASCYLPIFKAHKIIDDSYYIDGGFYDSCPVNTALKHKKYKNVYVIKIKGIGFAKTLIPNEANIIIIEPRRDNGSVFEMRRKTILDNIKMGYYDTLREIKHYDGYNYVFKPISGLLIKLITRKISKREIRRINNFFEVDNIKDSVIRSLEYILKKEEVDYYEVYNFYFLLRKYRKIKKNHFVYKFVNKLKIL